MLTKTQIEIMKVFVSKINEKFSIKQISEIIKKAYPLVHRSIKSLLNDGILIKDSKELISLNYRGDSQHIAYVESLRKNKILKNKTISLFIKDTLNKINLDFFVFLIFGSSVESKDPRDVDILLIIQEKEKINEVEKIVANIASNFCKLLLDNRRISKQLSTYYNPIESLLYEDSCVRGSFIHVETETGRLSCRNPNVQNQPKSFESNVKQHFTSRFKNGKILEVDFKQLEIVVQACLSKDKAYIQDIINGVDFHIKRLAASEEVPYAYVVNKINSKDINLRNEGPVYDRAYFAFK